MIEAEKAIYTVERMCELLEVSRSGYYKWRKSRERGPTPSQQRRVELDAKVARFHAALDGVDGRRRVLAYLRDDEGQAPRKTAAASLAPPGHRRGSVRRWVCAAHHGD